MEDIVLDESVLVADFLSEASVESLNLLREVGIDTVTLICISEVEFQAALTSIPSSERAQLWNLIGNWRRRNKIESVLVLSAEPKESPEASSVNVSDEKHNSCDAEITVEQVCTEQAQNEAEPSDHCSIGSCEREIKIEYPEALNETEIRSDILQDTQQSTLPTQLESVIAEDVSLLPGAAQPIVCPSQVVENEKKNSQLPEKGNCAETGDESAGSTVASLTNLHQSQDGEITGENHRNPEASDVSKKSIAVETKSTASLQAETDSQCSSDVRFTFPAKSSQSVTASTVAYPDEPELEAEQAVDNQLLQEIATKKNSLPLLTPSGLKEILSQSIYGKQILQNAETHVLSASGCKFVVDTVTRHHIASNRRTTAEAVEDYSEVIIRLFTKEKKHTYFIPRKGRTNPGGKLFSRINYVKQSERIRDRKEEQHIGSTGEAVQQEIDPEVESAISWLKINNIPWDSVLTRWEVCFPVRKSTLQQQSKAKHIIESYPHLQDEFGYQLLDIDFRLLGLGNPAEGVNKWTSMFDPISNYMAKHARDPSAKDLIRTLKDPEISTDSRVLSTLLALNTVLIPVKAAKGFKPTVATAQGDTFQLVRNKEEVLTEIKRSEEVCENQRMPMSPKLFVLGDNLNSVTGECFVIYKNIEYKLSSAARGVDVLVKLQIVLGLPISKLSKLVWVFVHKFVYGADSNHGGYLCVNKLIDHLNNC